MGEQHRQNQEITHDTPRYGNVKQKTELVAKNTELHKENSDLRDTIDNANSFLNRIKETLGIPIDTPDIDILVRIRQIIQRNAYLRDVKKVSDASENTLSMWRLEVTKEEFKRQVWRMIIDAAGCDVWWDFSAEDAQQDLDDLFENVEIVVNE